ncbi:ABC transporter permease, partial [candidate division KSB1 bacterium]|nr:ABC transporter permease [candidate division KSB1 bacterium]NIR70857.1 ABC transporter permease [candidate division KSB1 bacterium]NIS24643.1 ABC transporter permease [candidate division KSB1 bacterium]NIT71545.1 ABC transporter permease [candidate division KSB1 bacterium]NIU25243.1 ABC transporter permease [candidate division KSB1 bacterium]
MFKNYLKIALRNLRKYKAYSFINLFGLAIGMACCILIVLYIHDELNFDRFHENWQRIYRIVENRSSPDQGERQFAITMPPLGPTMVEEFPEVANAVRFIMAGRFTMEYKNNKF